VDSGSHYLGRTENVSAAGQSLARGPGPAPQEHRFRPRPKHRLSGGRHDPADRTFVIQHHVHHRILPAQLYHCPFHPFRSLLKLAAI